MRVNGEESCSTKSDRTEALKWNKVLNWYKRFCCSDKSSGSVLKEDLK